MIKVQIHYTTIDGVKKSKVYSYVNPAASDVTIKDFANAMYSLTTNTTDIITPIVTTGKQSPNLQLSKSNFTVHRSGDMQGVNYVDSDTVTVSYSGGGTLTVSSDNNAVTASVSGSTVTVSHSAHFATKNGWNDSAAITVTCAESNDYYSDTASFNVSFNAPAYQVSDEDDTFSFSSDYEELTTEQIDAIEGSAELIGSQSGLMGFFTATNESGETPEELTVSFDFGGYPEFGGAGDSADFYYIVDGDWSEEALQGEVDESGNVVNFVFGSDIIEYIESGNVIIFAIQIAN